MNKKLLAAAVAGALALPGAAMAQVTINGIFKVGIDQYSKDRVAPSANNDSEMRITDNSSRIIIGVSEDLGGGLTAIGQWDLRAPMDSASSLSNSGNTWVGLRSNSWGSITLGRHDLHYGSQPDDIAAKAGALMAAAVSLMDFTANGTAIANATRTPNVVRWDSPNWGGFALTAAYSTGNSAQEADLTGTETGMAYNLKATFTAANWQIGGSMWSMSSDGATSATQVEQDSQVAFGYIRFGGLKVGAAVNMAKVKVGGVDSQDRMSFTVPVSFTTGAHNFYAHYTVADDDDVTAAEDGATMMALAYVYDLSKRTSVGVTFAQIDNDAGAAYNFFTNTGGLGSTSSAMTAGEDGQLIAFTVRHAF